MSNQTPVPARHVQLATELRLFIETFEEGKAEALADMLFSLSDRERTRLFTVYGDIVTVDSMQRLIDRTHGLLSKDTYAAMHHGRLATTLAQYLWEHPVEDSRLEGDAWKEYASALLKMGRFADAKQACEQADLFYSLVEDRDYERTVLWLIEGQILHFLGKTDEGLVRIEQSANLLLAFFGRRKKYVEARIIYATILLRVERWRDALEVLESSRDIAREEGDLETLAHILNNVAYCYTNLGDQRKAYECFSAARDIFTELQLWVEVQRPQVGLTIVLKEEGRYAEALSELYKTRDVFLKKLRMPLDAARVAVRIVEVSLLANKTSTAIESLCAETITTFQNAGLHREAMKALAYLYESARLHRVQMADVLNVQDFLERLENTDTATRFDPAQVN
jgi:tetratricopeptide (TPR) repeat protein